MRIKRKTKKTMGILTVLAGLFIIISGSQALSIAAQSTGGVINPTVEKVVVNGTRADFYLSATDIQDNDPSEWINVYFIDASNGFGTLHGTFYSGGSCYINNPDFCLVQYLADEAHGANLIQANYLTKNAARMTINTNLPWVQGADGMWHAKVSSPFQISEGNKFYLLLVEYNPDIHTIKMYSIEPVISATSPQQNESQQNGSIDWSIEPDLWKNLQSPQGSNMRFMLGSVVLLIGAVIYWRNKNV